MGKNNKQYIGYNKMNTLYNLIIQAESLTLKKIKNHKKLRKNNLLKFMITPC